MSQPEKPLGEMQELSAKLPVGGFHGGDNGAEAKEELQAAQRAINRAISRLPWLGAKEGSIQSEPIGYRQEFQQATVWTARLSQNAFEVHGNIRGRFNQIKGNSMYGHLGVPTTDEAWARDHQGRFNNFVGGSIYWTEESKAWEIYGENAKVWFVTNAELGFLKYPTSTQMQIGPGSWQSFQGGAIYWLPTSSPIALPQPILDRYNSLGGPTGVLGFPIVKEIPENSQPGTYFKFEHGKIHWQGTPQSVFVEMFSKYTFSIDSIQCESTRSREKDTLYISAAVGLSLRDTVATGRSLGRSGLGFTVPNIVIPNVSIADEDVGVFAYTVMNDGHQTGSEALQNLESATKALAQKAGEAAGQAAGNAIGDAVGKAVASGAAESVGTFFGGIIGAGAGGPLGAFVGAALGALSSWLVGLGIDLLSPDCDGLVAAGSPPLGGVDLKEGTAQTGVYKQTVQHPGSDSPAGCGDNSYYVVNWSVTKVG